MSAETKISRAKKHFHELDTEISSFWATTPFEMTKVELENNDVSYRVIVHREPPAKDLASIVGDIVHNLRSALDLRVCELVVANGGTINPRHSFPIFDSQAKFNTSVNSRLSGIHASYAAKIAALKPYLPDSPLIWEIHELDILDKHRQLLIAGSAHSGVIIDFAAQLQKMIGKTIGSLPMELYPADKSFPLKTNTEVFRVMSAARGADLGVPQFRFDIYYSKDGSSQPQPLVSRLSEMIQASEQILSDFA
jgi:hypothetical protein